MKVCLIQSQIKPWLFFGESFTFSSTRSQSDIYSLASRSLSVAFLFLPSSVNVLFGLVTSVMMSVEAADLICIS